MQVCRSIAAVRAALLPLRQQGSMIGLVPTMGYLHEGHLSLVDLARRECDVVVLSLFVNPTQFGPNEDYEQYPRDELRDQQLCEAHGVDYVFAPAVDEMYGGAGLTSVHVDQLTDGLCGATRPGHFDGVCTVVAKLFNIVQPLRAYFGRKDYQQSVVIRQLVADLNFPLEVIVAPTVRESDGLALSSRNAYLGAEDRQAAVILYRSLQRAVDAFAAGTSNAEQLRNAVQQELSTEPRVAVEYCEVVDERALPVDEARPGNVIACALRIGGIRLIDNMILDRKS